MDNGHDGQSILVASAKGSSRQSPRNADAVGIVVVRRDGCIAYANTAAEGLFLAEPGALANRLFGHPIVGGDSADIDVFTSNGHLTTAEMRALPIEWEGLPAHLVLLHGTHERRRTHESLHKSNELLHALVAYSPIAIVATDAMGHITLWNCAAATITGWSDVDMLGNRLPETSDDPEESLAGIWEQAMRGDAVVGRELVNQRGRARSDMTLEVWASPIRDAQGIASGAMLLLADVTGRRRIEAHIRHMVGHDTITGLPNQRQFRKQLKRTIGTRGRRRHKPIMVLHLGLDRFKHINRSLGRGRGDLLLQLVARRLSGALYETDLLARCGGDEFSILLRDTHRLHDAARIANRLLLQLAEPFSLDGQELFLTGSIGIAVHPHDAENAEDLMRAAEDAMDRAKQRGSNSCQFYTPDLDSHAQSQLTMEHALHRALEREQLFLEFQPQFDLGSGSICSAEALLRWKHPKLGPVPPGSFIPLAEACGAIVPIGAWVLRQACRQLRDWDAAGLPPLRIAVNVSARQFHDEGFRAEVRAALQESAIDPDRLELELTESLMLRGAPEIIDGMRKLRALGVRLSVDDFGTGYSGLSYLVDLPVNSIKIDQSFVRSLGDKPGYPAIVRAIRQLAAGLGLEVVAEGVETEDQLEFLRSVQCDFAQGYYLSRPIAAEAVAALLREPSMAAPAARPQAS